MLTYPNYDMMRYMRKTVYSLLFSAFFVLFAGWTEALANTSFDEIPLHSSRVKSGFFQLTNGVYQEPASPGSASLLTIRLTERDRNLQEVSCVNEQVADQKNDRTDSLVLLDRLWTWKKSVYNNDTSAEPPKTQSYTLRLLPDGTVAAQVDCNRGGGIYRVDGNKLTIEITHTTRAFCADSLDSVFLRDVQGISSYFFRDDTLYFELKYDSGVMFFQ